MTEIFSGEIILYVHNLQDLEDIMKDLLKIDGVESYKIRRIIKWIKIKSYHY